MVLRDNVTRFFYNAGSKGDHSVNFQGVIDTSDSNSGIFKELIMEHCYNRTKKKKFFTNGYIRLTFLHLAVSDTAK